MTDIICILLPKPPPPTIGIVAISMRFPVQLFKGLCYAGLWWVDTCFLCANVIIVHRADTSDHIWSSELFIKHVVNSMRPNYVPGSA